MRWSAGDRENIEDRRGSSGRRLGGGASIGIGGILILLVLSWATGTNFLTLLDTGGAPMQDAGGSAPVQSTPEEERMVDFVNAVAGDVQQTWSQLLGSRYQPVKVVLFREVTETACGLGEAATGPFYCPGDRLVYLDLSFFQELSRRFGAPGDFAQAYVIAHEYGHHVQNLLGLNERVGNAAGPNSGSVALELQADCFAGVWGHAASQGGRFERGRVELDPGDADEALRAAAAIGDDRLQKMTTGRVQPERFTHGTSAQRVEWFRRGLQSGDPGRCDAFREITQ
jgi:predicted metalloprotease